MITTSFFLQVRKGLVPLIQEIKQKGTKPDSSLLAGSFDTTAQAALCNAIAVDLGFSLEQGRLDVSVHPFTGGNAMLHAMSSMLPSTVQSKSLLLISHYWSCLSEPLVVLDIAMELVAHFHSSLCEHDIASACSH